MAERISPYRRPSRVVFIGDKTECAKWLPWAKQKLFLFRRTLGEIWRKTLKPAPGVLVIITSVSDDLDSIIIEAGAAGYMESGYLNVGGMGAETIDPAHIFFNSRVAGLSNTSLPNASKRKKLVSGDPSGAIGVKEFDPQNPNKYLSRKQARLYCPPSVYTGKLRLFAQAIFGSKRRDFTVESEPLGWFLSLSSSGAKLQNDDVRDESRSTGDVKLHYTSGRSNGLLKTDDGNYILISIHNDTVTARRMRRKSSAVKVSNGHQNDPEAEAYTLATLAPDPDVVSVGSLPEILAFTPMPYGWHFNKAGDTAYMVGRRQITVAADQFPSKDPGTAAAFEFKLFKLQISSAKDEGAPLGYAISLDLEVVESGAWIPGVQGKLFVPSIAPSGDPAMLALFPDSTGTTGGYYAGAPTPLYAFFDDDDQLIVARGRNATFNTTAGGSDLDISCAHVFGTPGTDQHPDTLIRQRWPTTYDWGTYGLTINGNSYTGVQQDASGGDTQERFWHVVAPGDAFGTPSENFDFYDHNDWDAHLLSHPFADGTPYFEAADPNKTILYFDGPASYTIVIHKGDHQRVNYPIVIVPFDHASAVFAGNLSWINGQYQDATKFSTGTPGAQLYKAQFELGFNDGGVIKHTGEFEEAFYKWTSFHLNDAFPFDPLNNFDENDPQQMEALQTYLASNDTALNRITASLDLLGYHGTESIYAFDQLYPHTYPVLPGELETLFKTPNAETPFYEIRVSTQSPYFSDDNLFYFGTFSDAEYKALGEWDNSLNFSSPVGWA